MNVHLDEQTVEILARPLSNILLEYFNDPINKGRFEEWQRQRVTEQKD